MITTLRNLLMTLPIFRILRRHHDEQCEAQYLKSELLREQHDIARRVHVIEWQTFPHTRQDDNSDDH